MPRHPARRSPMAGSRPTGGGALIDALAEFEGVLDAVPDAMVGVDRSGIIRFVNHRAAVLFGYDREDLVGQLIETLVPESSRTVHQAQREGYVADPTTREMGAGPELIGRRRDGTEFPIDIGLAHLGTGEDMVVIAAVRDMTARHEAEQSRREADRIAAVVEFNGDAIISSTLDGVVTIWNPAAEKLFGYPKDEIVGKFVNLLSPREGIHEIGLVVAEVMAGHSVENLETQLVRQDGTVFPASLTASPICDADGTVIGISAIPRDITERKQAFQTAQHMAAIVNSSDDAIIGVTLDGVITSWNPAAERMYGYGSDETVGGSIALVWPERLVSEGEGALAKVKAGKHVSHLETVRVRKDGTRLSVSLTISPVCDSDGTVIGACATARDVTEQRQAAAVALRMSVAEELVSTLMASTPVGVALADLDGSIRVANEALCHLVGCDEAWFQTRRVDDIVHPDDLDDLLRRRRRLLAGSRDVSVARLRLVRVDGVTVWVHQITVLTPDTDGRPNHLFVQFEDVTAEHEAVESLAYRAAHDELTGLHSRAWILDNLSVDLRAARRMGTSVATLFLDLDNLKVVNDSLGHAAGDQVLVAVADRIVAVLRPGDRVGRFGGDEFVIVVQGVHDAQEVERFAELVSASISTDLKVNGHRIVPTASIGIALSSPTSAPDALLRDTDSALYRAKALGRGHWQVFDAVMHAQAMARLTVEDELRVAIIRHEFEVQYQPIVALTDAHVVGYEALVRWKHPTRGLLSPEDFLDVAEDSGLITTIGAQVLEQACVTLADHPDLPGPISVNVSAVQLGAPDWLSSVTDALARHGVEPSRIVIEVTETAVLSLVDSARSALASLRGLGIGIHVDDFGTGYSSISLLRDLPVTGVKLDLRFVQDLTSGDSMANALARGLAGLVRGMHLTGIAEGIETEMQARILLGQGWECGQGYYFGRSAAIPEAD